MSPMKKAQSPGLFLAFILQGVASPMMAAPAFATSMWLDAIVLVTLIASTTLVPFGAPPHAFFFVGPIGST